MHGRRSRAIVDKAITALLNLEHRGAAGADTHSGDGAGIMLQVPDAFLRAVVDFELPAEGALRHRYGIPTAVRSGCRRSVRPWRRSSRPRASTCWAGGTSRPTIRRWVLSRATPCRRSVNCSSAAPPGWSWNGVPT